MASKIEIACNILTTLLTGGFVLLFIEILHLEKDVINNFRSTMLPYYNKLSHYVRYAHYYRVSLSRCETNLAIDIMKHIDNICKLCNEALPFGAELDFKSDYELKEINHSLHELWELLDNNRYFTIEGATFNFSDTADDALATLNPELVRGAEHNLCLFHQVSGDLYSKTWQPVQYCTENYEYWQKLIIHFRRMSLISIGISLTSLIIIFILYENIPYWLLLTLVLISVALFLVCLAIMIYSSKKSEAVVKKVSTR